MGMAHTPHNKNVRDSPPVRGSRGASGDPGGPLLLGRGSCRSQSSRPPGRRWVCTLARPAWKAARNRFHCRVRADRACADHRCAARDSAKAVHGSQVGQTRPPRPRPPPPLPAGLDAMKGQVGLDRTVARWAIWAAAHTPATLHGSRSVQQTRRRKTTLAYPICSTTLRACWACCSICSLSTKRLWAGARAGGRGGEEDSRRRGSTPW